MAHSREIPKFLSHLQVYRGLAVPFAQLVVNGVPDFRIIDMELLERSIEEKLCGVCGKKLGNWCYFIGGPACRASHAFKDPPMHKVCAEFSAHHCPFLDGRHTEYSERPFPVVPGRPLLFDGHIEPRRPEKMCLMRATTKLVRLVDDEGTIDSGPLLGTRYF